MIKEIDINGITCTFKSSAAIPKIYRMKYGRDLFIDMNRLAEEVSKQDASNSTLPVSSLEMFENIAYIMHKHGDASQPNDELEWLEQFEMFNIYEILPDLLSMWQKETQQMSSNKKKIEK